jgi:hypothetical protein
MALGDDGFRKQQGAVEMAVITPHARNHKQTMSLSTTSVRKSSLSYSEDTVLFQTQFHQARSELGLLMGSAQELIRLGQIRLDLVPVSQYDMVLVLVVSQMTSTLSVVNGQTRWVPHKIFEILHHAVHPRCSVGDWTRRFLKEDE